MDNSTKQMIMSHVFYHLRWLIGLVLLYAVSTWWINNDYLVIPLDNLQMLPHFKPKQIHMGKRILASEIKHNDIVYMEYPHPRAENRRETLFFARVMGLPGDRIAIKNGRVHRNGELLEESYLDPGNISQENYSEVIVPRDHAYLLIDNRRKYGRELYYRDSRARGPIPINTIWGVMKPK